MESAFSRSWKITKITFKIIGQDKKMLMFPILAGLFSLIFMVAMIAPVFFSEVLTGDIVQYIIIALLYFGLAFIATFFNVCVVYMAKTDYEGKEASVGKVLGFAFSKIHLIAGWSLLSASVGILFRMLDNLAKKLGPISGIALRIVNSMLGLAWSILTIFVVPVMVFENKGPFAAIKGSVEVLKKTWGESLIRHFGLGLIEFLLFVIGIIGFVVFLIVAMMLKLSFSIIPILIIFIGYIVLVSIVFSLANTVFNVLLYLYAAKGIADPEHKEVFEMAFKKK